MQGCGKVIVNWKRIATPTSVWCGPSAAAGWCPACGCGGCTCKEQGTPHTYKDAAHMHCWLSLTQTTMLCILHMCTDPGHRGARSKDHCGNCAMCLIANKQYMQRC